MASKMLDDEGYMHAHGKKNLAAALLLYRSGLRMQVVLTLAMPVKLLRVVKVSGLTVPEGILPLQEGNILKTSWGGIC